MLADNKLEADFVKTAKNAKDQQTRVKNALRASVQSLPQCGVHGKDGLIALKVAEWEKG